MNNFEDNANQLVAIILALDGLYLKSWIGIIFQMQVSFRSDT